MTQFEEKLFDSLVRYNRNMPISRGMKLVNRETSGEPTVGTENPNVKVKFTGLQFEFTLEKDNE